MRLQVKPRLITTDGSMSKPSQSPIQTTSVPMDFSAALASVAEQLRLLRLPLSPLLSIDDAAQTLGVSRKTVDRLIADERLPVVSIESGRGDQRIKRIQASDLQAFIDARRHPAGRGTSRQHRRRVPSKQIRIPDVRLG